MDRGDIVLVFSHQLGFWCDIECSFDADCHHWRRCKVRPCWIARVDDDGVAVMPFSTSQVSDVVFYAGEGGLLRRSFMRPQAHTLAPDAIGPRVGYLSPKSVLSRIRDTVPFYELNCWLEVWSGGTRRTKQQTLAFT